MFLDLISSHIDKHNLLPPMMVIQLLARNANATLGTVKVLCVYLLECMYVCVCVYICFDVRVWTVSVCVYVSEYICVCVCTCEGRFYMRVLKCLWTIDSQPMFRKPHAAPKHPLNGPQRSFN